MDYQENVTNFDLIFYVQSFNSLTVCTIYLKLFYFAFSEKIRVKNVYVLHRYVSRICVRWNF